MDLDKNMCPVVKIDGFAEKGKQFDLDITIPEDNRNVIYGVIKDCYKEPVEDAVVKLIEIDFDHDKKERKPVSHTFTDKDGEFVFGPLCPDKKYEIQIWVDRVKHVKVCAECGRHGKCLKGIKLECKKHLCDDGCDDHDEHDECGKHDECNEHCNDRGNDCR